MGYQTSLRNVLYESKSHNQYVPNWLNSIHWEPSTVLLKSLFNNGTNFTWEALIPTTHFIFLLSSFSWLSFQTVMRMSAYFKTFLGGLILSGDVSVLTQPPPPSATQSPVSVRSKCIFVDGVVVSSESYKTIFPSNLEYKR